MWENMARQHPTMDMHEKEREGEESRETGKGKMEKTRYHPQEAEENRSERPCSH